MSKKRITKGASALNRIPTKHSVRDLGTFLNDAAGFRVTEPSAVENAFLAFAEQRGGELYNDEFIRRWNMTNPEHPFPFADDLLQECGVPEEMADDVTYLELVCLLYDKHTKTVDLAGAKSAVNSFHPYHIAFFCLSYLSQSCCFGRR